ncbi:MAG: hypothetical protein D6678_02875 [Zetaproteobacteria bacterium]|nr:MAG: hypothetical protein D6678_02875 [Zetaproteobacteria bacterium]
MRKCWILILPMLLLACGHKAPPQVASGSDVPPPRIVELHHELSGPALKLEFVLQGDPAGVGYQIDRAEIDPYCHCPGMWQRYYEQPPFAKQVGEHITKLLNLRVLDQEFLFRIRAIDAAGRFGPWSEPIRAKAVDLMRD